MSILSGNAAATEVRQLEVLWICKVKLGLAGQGPPDRNLALLPLGEPQGQKHHNHCPNADLTASNWHISVHELDYGHLRTGFKSFGVFRPRNWHMDE